MPGDNLNTNVVKQDEKEIAEEIKDSKKNISKDKDGANISKDKDGANINESSVKDVTKNKNDIQDTANITTKDSSVKIDNNDDSKGKTSNSPNSVSKKSPDSSTTIKKDSNPQKEKFKPSSEGVKTKAKEEVKTKAKEEVKTKEKEEVKIEVKDSSPSSTEAKEEVKTDESQGGATSVFQNITRSLSKKISSTGSAMSKMWSSSWGDYLAENESEPSDIPDLPNIEEIRRYAIERKSFYSYLYNNPHATKEYSHQLAKNAEEKFKQGCEIREFCDRLKYDYLKQTIPYMSQYLDINDERKRSSIYNLKLFNGKIITIDNYVAKTRFDNRIERWNSKLEIPDRNDKKLSVDSLMKEFEQKSDIKSSIQLSETLMNDSDNDAKKETIFRNLLKEIIAYQSSNYILFDKLNTIIINSKREKNIGEYDTYIDLDSLPQLEYMVNNWKDLASMLDSTKFPLIDGMDDKSSPSSQYLKKVLHNFVPNGIKYSETEQTLMRASMYYVKDVDDKVALKLNDDEQTLNISLIPFIKVLDEVDKSSKDSMYFPSEIEHNLDSKKMYTEINKNMRLFVKKYFKNIDSLIHLKDQQEVTVDEYTKFNDELFNDVKENIDIILSEMINMRDSGRRFAISRIVSHLALQFEILEPLFLKTYEFNKEGRKVAIDSKYKSISTPSIYNLWQHAFYSLSVDEYRDQFIKYCHDLMPFVYKKDKDEFNILVKHDGLLTSMKFNAVMTAILHMRLSNTREHVLGLPSYSTIHQSYNDSVILETSDNNFVSLFNSCSASLDLMHMRHILDNDYNQNIPSSHTFNPRIKVYNDELKTHIKSIPYYIMEDNKKDESTNNSKANTSDNKEKVKVKQNITSPKPIDVRVEVTQNTTSPKPLISTLKSEKPTTKPEAEVAKTEVEVEVKPEAEVEVKPEVLLKPEVEAATKVTPLSLNTGKLGLTQLKKLDEIEEIDVDSLSQLKKQGLKDNVKKVSLNPEPDVKIISGNNSSSNSYIFLFIITYMSFVIIYGAFIYSRENSPLSIKKKNNKKGLLKANNAKNKRSNKISVGGKNKKYKKIK